MPNLRVAFLCVLSTVILFSCKTKTKDSIATNNPTPNDHSIKIPLPDETIDINSLNTKFIEAATQHFSVSSKMVSSITSKGGVKIKVDPGSLEKEDGVAMEGNIEVSIIELTNVNDLFKSNAATVSNGRLLVSGGSYFIGMENGGKKMRIKSGQVLQAEFPRLKKEEMELFYGERDTKGNMNWLKTGEQLQTQYETTSFNVSNSESLQLPDLNLKKGYYLYNSINEKVNFSGNMVSVKDMVAMLQRRGIDKIIDTVYNYWNMGYGINYRAFYTRDSESTYGRFWKKSMQFRVISGKESLAEKDSLTSLWCKYTEKRDKKQKESLFKIQLRNNYAPTGIKKLGWINCDSFYDTPQQTVPNIELPYAFNNSQVHYFILFKSINSLLTGQTVCNSKSIANLQAVPVGAAITLIAFTKKDGIIYRARQDLVTGKNIPISLDLKKISAGEVTDIFDPKTKI